MVIVVVEGTVRNRRLKCRPWISFCEGGLDGTSFLTRVAVLQGMRRAKLSRGEKLFAGGTDVWVGVGRAPEGRPKDEDGGRGRSAPTYAHPESISLRSNPGQTSTILPAVPSPLVGKKEGGGGILPKYGKLNVWSFHCRSTRRRSFYCEQVLQKGDGRPCENRSRKRARVFRESIKFSPDREE